MKRMSILLFITTSLVMSSYGQKGFSSGYIISNSGDTIPGLIKDRTTGMFPELYKEIKFRPTKGRKKRLGPSEIAAYAKGSQVFHAVELRENDNFLENLFNKNNQDQWEYEFMIIVIDGPVMLYRYEFNAGDDGESIDSRLYVKRKNDDTFVSLNWIGFAKRAKSYFQDAPDIVQAIENKTYRFRDTYSLVEDYNKWFRDQHGR